MTEKLTAEEARSNYYEDEYVKVQDDVLRIKLYYFPYGDRTITVSKIKSIKYAEQKDSYAKNWGSSSFTWWACDMKRNFRDEKKVFYNVSVNNGEFFSKGFTVQDVVSFIRSMQNHLIGCEIGRLDALA